jgi:hypothetical protein
MSVEVGEGVPVLVGGVATARGSGLGRARWFRRAEPTPAPAAAGGPHLGQDVQEVFFERPRPSCQFTSPPTLVCNTQVR